MLQKYMFFPICHNATMLEELGGNPTDGIYIAQKENKIDEIYPHKI